jgi:hypothetical protein
VKALKVTLVVIAGFAAAAGTLPATGRGGRGGHGGGGYDSLYRSEHISSRASVTGPVFAPWYPAPPYWYYEQTVAVPPYIERDPAASSGSQPQYWYFCKTAGIYYPYILECPEGWREVAPQLPRS